MNISPILPGSTDLTNSIRSKITSFREYLTLRNIVIFLMTVGIILFLVLRPRAKALTYAVVRGDLERSIAATGRVEQSNEVSLAFQSSGQVKKILVESGSPVKKGTLLAELDLGTLNGELKEARANLISAKIDREKNNLSIGQKVTDLDSDSIKTKNALQALYSNMMSSDLEARPNESKYNTVTKPNITGVYKGDSETAQLKFSVYPANSASGYAASFTGLYNGSVELSQVNPIQIGSTGLYIQLPTTASSDSLNGSEWIIDLPNKSSTKYASNLYNYLEAKKNYETVLKKQKNEIDISTTSVNGMNSYDATVSRYRAMLERVHQNIQMRGIYAPVDGIIGRISIKSGQQITQSTDAMALLGGKNYLVKLKVPESVIGGVKIGDKARVVIDALLGETLSATVTSIDTAETYVEGTPVYETTIVIEDKNEGLKSGMHATGTVILDSKKDVLLVPEIAINRMQKTPTVEKIVDIKSGKKTKTEIEITGKGSNGFVSVTGLAEKDSIVLPSNLPETVEKK